MPYRRCQIRGREVALPITNGALYRDAFHGTTISRAEAVERNSLSESPEGWYGPGVYFWLGVLRAAIWFARTVRGWQTNWAVMQAIVDSGQTLNIDQLWDNDDIQRAVEDVNWGNVREKGWSSADIRSGVAALCVKACEEAGIKVDSIFYFEPIRDLERPVRALCLRSRENIRRIWTLRREDVPWRLGEIE